MRLAVYFVSSSTCRAGRSGSDIPFFRLLSGGHGRLSTSPAPWRRGALLPPLRGPPGFWFPPQKSALPNSIFSGSSRKRRARPGEQVPPCLRAPRKRVGQKKEIRSCIRTAFPSSASSATTYN